MSRALSKSSSINIWIRKNNYFYAYYDNYDNCHHFNNQAHRKCITPNFRNIGSQKIFEYSDRESSIYDRDRVPHNHQTLFIVVRQNLNLWFFWHKIENEFWKRTWNRIIQSCWLLRYFTNLKHGFRFHNYDHNTTNPFGKIHTVKMLLKSHLVS